MLPLSVTQPRLALCSALFSSLSCFHLVCCAGLIPGARSDDPPCLVRGVRGSRGGHTGSAHGAPHHCPLPAQPSAGTPGNPAGNAAILTSIMDLSMGRGRGRAGGGGMDPPRLCPLPEPCCGCPWQHQPGSGSWGGSRCCRVLSSTSTAMLQCPGLLCDQQG